MKRISTYVLLVILSGTATHAQTTFVCCNGTGTGGGTGTVTSVAATVPSVMSVTGSPVTTDGTLAFDFLTQSANLIFASPSGSSGAPLFRALVAADLPATAVTPGSYTNASITVDTTGRITAASSGSGGICCNAGTPTTPDTGADSLMAATAAGKTPLVLQAAPTPTADWFRVESSAGASGAGLRVQSDGGLIVNQQTGATFTRMLDVKWQGSTKFQVEPTLVTVAAGTSLNVGGGFFLVDSNGNTTVRHLVASGTSPSVGGSCGTSPSIAGKDTFFRITTGTGSPTSCTVTFGNSYTTAPACVANASLTTAPLNITTTTTSATISAAALTAGEALHVTCGGF